MNIDFSKMKTAGQLAEEKKQAALGAVHVQRRAAYLAESDPLKLEADYDALSQGLEPDYTAWLASVAAIKARYPLPAIAAD
ncbi:hypothetical protein HX813_24025 [Pseudomonas yamanorum]|uniref:hypothetical protein n=1 Tax=Pseudomonas yamanorum TaxID=515393 RepID=UPI0015A26C4B|nr:hypothetical protein [Pseudomonas yamanorum]NVZ91305.1 hypothetical protein [Pseudomonas yamanorum]